MCKQCEPSVPVTRLIGRSDIGDSFGRVKDAASNNIHNIITLSRSFAWNYVAVCGGRISLKILVKDHLICGNTSRASPLLCLWNL